ncbi:MAG: hypothetical protein ACFCD0_23705 [Gemmataceae bacterium]
MTAFDFHPDLFEYRNTVLETLAEHGYSWLAAFSSVDLLHDVHGLEVCGIHEEDDAREIQTILSTLLPEWQYKSRYYNDVSRRDPGWKVKIARDPENYNDDWKATTH